MRQAVAILAPLLLLTGCGDQPEPPPAAPASPELEHVIVPTGPQPQPRPQPGQVASPAATAPSLVEARRGFQTRPAPNQPGDPLPEPPAGVFQLVEYDSPVGKLAAYLSPDPGDGQKHPAIVWITGGDCNSIGEVWEEAPRENDQSAAAYRKAGIIMMFPSLRGGNQNPGAREGFYGEVDDVLAAADSLAAVPYVDPNRIYLGGHSTGGTLVMLVAESSTDRFRAVFAFGPVHDIRGYGGKYSPFDTSNPKEFELRAPLRWLAGVRCPLFVIEGMSPPSNAAALRVMAAASKNPLIQFLPVPGRDHFSILAPANERIAAKILADEGPTTNITLSPAELRGTP